jgi:hypothetical protein
MIHTTDQLLAWLRTTTARRDRVLCNVLNTGVVEEILVAPPGWRVALRSRRGVEYRIDVVMHPVTGEPTRYYREINNDSA